MNKTANWRFTLDNTWNTSSEEALRSADIQPWINEIYKDLYDDLIRLPGGERDKMIKSISYRTSSDRKDLPYYNEILYSLEVILGPNDSQYCKEESLCKDAAESPECSGCIVACKVRRVIQSLK